MSYANLRRIEFWLLLIGGLAWMDAGAGNGLVSLVLVSLPGAAMLTAAIGFAMFPGVHGIARTGALGALIGVVFAVPLLLAEPAVGLGLMAISAAGFVSCGLIGAEVVPLPPGLERVPRTARLGAEVGTDEAVLGVASITMGTFASGEQSRIAAEVEMAVECFEDQGWLKSPASFHPAPPMLEAEEVDLKDASVSRIAYEVMSFDSGFAPRTEVPGSQRYAGYAPCRRAYAWILRGDEGAPWLVNVHGLGMGLPWLDFKVLQADLLRRLGLNLVFPILPLHGPRALSVVSGRGYLTGEVMDTIHAESQALWDIRRIIGWLWGQGADRIGLHGVSLGGYTVSLMAALEEGLRCAIAGIPAVDPAWLLSWHSSAAAQQACESEGLTLERLTEVLRVVSPLAMDPLVPEAHRYIYAGRADRFVPPVVVERLYDHWGQPKTHWYPGAHLTGLAHPGLLDFLTEALKTSLVSSD
ncbi:MAG: hypothetical protein JSW21_07995 [Gammaproteobacteria bacterium]|nr:MAG: hypothetical protein JSW21_07995 [Gammaproteobacteria bacterium]